MSARNWCFTTNNPDLADAETIRWLINQSSVQFLHCTLETGDQGTPHYQGYLQLDRHKRLSTVKNLLPTGTHLEPRKGTAYQALNYCLKTLTEEQVNQLPKDYSSNSTENCLPLTQLPTSITINTDTQSLNGILSTNKSKKPNKEERLLSLKDKICNGATNVELAELDFPIWCQYYRQLDQYRTMISKPRDHETNIIVVQGPTGTGKSRWAKDTYPNAYWKQRSIWWDGYTGQDVVIIDEFYGWLPYDLLLRICDRYPLLVETKGGQVNFAAKTIVFTSNSIPERWYKNAYFKAFIRRVKTWMVMPRWGEVFETDDYLEAQKRMADGEF